MIEETMARVERKQMNESLEAELAEAVRVLEAMAVDAKRSDDEHKKQQQQRYRMQELERERRRINQRDEGEGTRRLVRAKDAGSTGVAPVTIGSSVPDNRNVTVINAEVRVVKCTIDNVSVELTANRVGALGALLLLDAMDLRVGQDRLLK